LGKDNVLRVEQFQFTDKFDSDNVLKTNFTFKNCNFKDEFSIYGLKQNIGTFDLSHNTFGSENPLEFGNFMFQNSKFSNVWFLDNKFLSYTSFVNCEFFRSGTILKDKPIMRKANSFIRNEFDDLYIKDCSILNIEGFTRCQFMGRLYFEELKYNESTSLYFSECTFHNYTSFNKSSFSELLIDKTTFKDMVSLQQASFEKVYLDLTNFEKTAYFDDIKISDISKCDRKTLRTIKQQLQKTDNKIDYNRFRSYELSAYYRELKWNWNDGKDKFILGATWLATGFDHSWRRALLFTIVSGLFWYSIVYFFEFFFALNLAGDDNFMKGAFRFFLVTDFSSPFKAKGEFLENWGIWIPLVLGKIFIAFGIYEMIQAFRKFKA
jgi:hypothetical protein